MKHLKVINSDGKTITSNLKTDCENCYNDSNEGKVISLCPIYKEKRRLGKKIINKGETFLCCNETKTTKLFKNKLEGLSNAFEDLKLPEKELTKKIKIEEQKRVNRLVHNLTSINAHNIQEIYDLIPQDVLASNLKSQLSYIENEIKKDVLGTAKLFLRIAKNNIHMKSEFSIYNKLDRADTSLNYRKHPIRKVILNTLHTFFSDFSDKGVYVDVQEYNNLIKIDYETFQVALYHLIENAEKYTKPDSTITIKFTEDNGLTIDFIMDSLVIKDNEISKVFDEGYSGEEANKIGKQGNGIGLWRIQQMLNLNNSTLEIITGADTEDIMGFKFSNNTFRIKIN